MYLISCNKYIYIFIFFIIGKFKPHGHFLKVNDGLNDTNNLLMHKTVLFYFKIHLDALSLLLPYTTIKCTWIWTVIKVTLCVTFMWVRKKNKKFISYRNATITAITTSAIFVSAFFLHFTSKYGFIVKSVHVPTTGAKWLTWLKFPLTS